MTCGKAAEFQHQGLRACLDGLARMNQVTEDPGGLGCGTAYTHDALGNLTGVSEMGQTRTFLYDSLSRLTSATNPESGTVGCAYDNNGNMATRTDARGTITHYSTTSCPYDALNRLQCKSYSDSTPSVTYTYDQSSCLGGQSPCCGGSIEEAVWQLPPLSISNLQSKIILMRCGLNLVIDWGRR